MGQYLLPDERETAPKETPKDPSPGWKAGAAIARLLGNVGSGVIGFVPGLVSTPAAAGIAGVTEALAQKLEQPSGTPVNLRRAQIEAILGAAPGPTGAGTKYLKGIKNAKALWLMARGAGLTEAGNIARRKEAAGRYLPETPEEAAWDVGTSALGGVFGKIAGTQPVKTKPTQTLAKPPEPPAQVTREIAKWSAANAKETAQEEARDLKNLRYVEAWQAKKVAEAEKVAKTAQVEKAAKEKARDIKNLQDVKAWQAQKVKSATEAEKIAENEQKLIAIAAAKEGREATKPSISEGITAKTPEGGRASMSQRFIEPAPPEGEDIALGMSLLDDLAPMTPTIARQTMFSTADAAKNAAIKTGATGVVKMGRGSYRLVYEPAAPAAKASIALTPAEARAKSLTDLEAKIQSEGEVAPVPEPGSPKGKAQMVPEQLIAPKEVALSLERDVVSLKRYTNKQEASAIAKATGGLVHQDGPRQYSIHFKEEIPTVPEAITPSPTIELPMPTAKPPAPRGGGMEAQSAGKAAVEAPTMFDRGGLTADEFHRYKDIQPMMGAPRTAAERAEYAALAVKRARQVEAAPEQAGLLESAEGGAIPVANLTGREARIAAARATYSPEANAKLDDLATRYATATDPVEKRGLGAQMSEISRMEKARLKAESVIPKTTPDTAPIIEGPTNAELSRMTPEDQMTALTNLVTRFRKPKGGSTVSAFGAGQLKNMLQIAAENPKFAEALTTIAGAGVGAGMNEEDPFTGALVGGAVGFGAGSAVGKLPVLLGRSGTGRSAQEATNPIIGRAPSYIRGALLSDPRSVGINSIAGPMGSNFWGGIEEFLKGKASGDIARAQGGLQAIKSVGNIPKWMTQFFNSLEAAKERLHSVEELGRAGRFEQVGNRNLWDKVVETPATFMLSGDLTAGKNLLDAGIPEGLMRAYTLTAEPKRALWKTIVNFARTLNTSGVDTALISTTMAPFVRTAANIMEMGTERTPILGSIINYRGDPKLRVSLADQAIQQSIGLLTFGLGFTAGSITDPELDKTLKIRNLVSNLGGPYALLSGSGFAAGRAMQLGKNPADAVVTEMTQSIPLPTTGPVVDLAKKARKLASGEFESPIDVIPSMTIPKAVNFVLELEELTGLGLGFPSLSSEASDTQPTGGGYTLPDER